MKKRVKMLFAAAICAATLSIVGCGGNANHTTTSEAAQEEAAEAQAEAEDPAAKFLGDWKLAYIESQGMTIMGDLSGLQALSGADMSIGLTINDDGTASMTLGSESADMKWEQVSDDKFSLTVASESKEGEEAKEGEEELLPESIDVTCTGDELRFNLTSSTDEQESGEGIAEAMTTGAMVLTHDGTSDRVSVPSLADATPITSADALVGDWKLRGMGIFGLVMVGDTDNVDELFGEESGNVSFAEDGSCNFIGSDATYVVDENGAKVTDKQTNTEASISALGDDIVIDLSDSLGAMFGSDKPLFLIYSH